LEDAGVNRCPTRRRNNGRVEAMGTEFKVNIKATLRCEDDVDVTKDDLIDEIGNEIDNSDIEVTAEAIDDDSTEGNVTFALVLDDVDIIEPANTQ
jgi:hypothetical protein